MRATALRIFRTLLVAFAAYVAIAWSRQGGVPWLGYTLAVAVLSVWLGSFLLGLKKQRTLTREARWEEAIYEPKQRGRAIREVRKAVKALEPLKQKERTEHARLSIMLAELLDAESDYTAAMAAIDRVQLEALPAIDAGLVRHTRAVTHLRGDDPEGARKAVEGRAPSGDTELDQRLSLLEAYAMIELGDIATGQAKAASIETTPGIDESVLVEARVVRAAALDAGGRREEALVVLAALGRDALSPLSQLGQPRVRALSKLVLDGSAA